MYELFFSLSFSFLLTFSQQLAFSIYFGLSLWVLVFSSHFFALYGISGSFGLLYGIFSLLSPGHWDGIGSSVDIRLPGNGTEGHYHTLSRSRLAARPVCREKFFLDFIYLLDNPNLFISPTGDACSNVNVNW